MSTFEEFMIDQKVKDQSELDTLKSQLAATEQKLRESEAGAAKLRECLAESRLEDCNETSMGWKIRRDQALSATAGKSLLAELEDSESKGQRQ